MLLNFVIFLMIFKEIILIFGNLLKILFGIVIYIIIDLIIL